jgi:polyhydroxyalkanoate synthesis regulator phasin
MSNFDNWVMEHYEEQEENMVEEKKPRLTLEEGQALLKVLLKEVKYGPVSVDKAQAKMEEITKDMQYPIDDTERPIKDNG